MLKKRAVEEVEVETVVVDGESPTLASPEVEARPKRRRFTAEYKARILREAERASRPGEIGALLRREGLYASHLITWRRQVQKDGVGGLSRKRGRKADPEIGLARKNAQLEKTNQRLTENLRKAEFIIEFQKKMAELWATPVPTENEGTK